MGTLGLQQLHQIQVKRRLKKYKYELRPKQADKIEGLDIVQPDTEGLAGFIIVKN